MNSKILCIIPARAGSKGLPGKNIRELAGLPLIVHSLECAKLCPSISRTVVSTDGVEIAELVKRHGGEVPFLRPESLAADSSATLPVLQHSLEFIENEEGTPYDFVVLFEPTGPTRLPEDIQKAVTLIESSAEIDAVVTVSEPHFSPYWHFTEDQDGFGKLLFEKERVYTRRQDLPKTYFINGLVYVFRRNFLKTTKDWTQGRIRLLPTPTERVVNIDTLQEFKIAEVLLESGLINLPWLSRA